MSPMLRARRPRCRYLRRAGSARFCRCPAGFADWESQREGLVCWKREKRGGRQAASPRPSCSACWAEPDWAVPTAAGCLLPLAPRAPGAGPSRGGFRASAGLQQGFCRASAGLCGSLPTPSKQVGVVGGAGSLFFLLQKVCPAPRTAKAWHRRRGGTSTGMLWSSQRSTARRARVLRHPSLPAPACRDWWAPRRCPGARVARSCSETVVEPPWGLLPPERP